eukprot:NODE_184_length_13742_cov_0.550539.p6 type:complete len:307 gc:universal NODE_184_length_13742_cov_0.550539:6397-7317(+)
MLLSIISAYDAFFNSKYYDQAKCTTFLKNQLDLIDGECDLKCSLKCTSAFKRAISFTKSFPSQCKVPALDPSQDLPNSGETAKALIATILYSESVYSAVCSKRTNPALESSKIIHTIITESLIANSDKWSTSLDFTDPIEKRLIKLFKHLEIKYSSNEAKARFLTIIAKHNQVELDLSKNLTAILSPKQVYSSFVIKPILSASITRKLDQVLNDTATAKISSHDMADNTASSASSDQAILNDSSADAVDSLRNTDLSPDSSDTQSNTEPLGSSFSSKLKSSGLEGLHKQVEDPTPFQPLQNVLNLK